MTDERLAEICQIKLVEYKDTTALLVELKHALKAEREENQRLKDECIRLRIEHVNHHDAIKAIRELPDKWRNKKMTGPYQCADELEAKLKENQHE